jgi:hypothetical protein
MSTLGAIARAIFALAQFLDSLMRDAAQRRAVEAGEDRATAHSLKEQTARVEQARSARRAVDADRLPDDDPYRRD